jgi:hypothetical protein
VLVGVGLLNLVGCAHAEDASQEAGAPVMSEPALSGSTPSEATETS